MDSVRRHYSSAETTIIIIKNLPKPLKSYTVYVTVRLISNPKSYGYKVAMWEGSAKRSLAPFTREAGIGRFKGFKLLYDTQTQQIYPSVTFDKFEE